MIPVFDKNAAFVWALYGLTVGGVLLTILVAAIHARLAKARLQRMKALNQPDGDKS